MDKFLTTVEVAHLIGCSPGSLANSRAHQRGLPYEKGPTGRVFYRASVIAAFLAKGAA